MLYHVEIDRVPAENLEAAREALSRHLERRPPDLEPAVAGGTVRVAEEVPLYRAEELFADLVRAGASVRLVPVPAAPGGAAPPEPGSFRPLTARERRAWARRAFRECWFATLVGLGVAGLLGGLAQAAGAGLTAASGVAGLVLGGGTGRLLAGGLAGLGIAVAVAGAMLPQTLLLRIPSRWLETGRTKGALREAMRRTPDLAAATLLLGAVLGAGPAVALWAGPPWAAAAVPLVALSALAALGFLLLGPVVVHEEVGPIAGLLRAWRLLSGRRLRLLGELAWTGLGVAIASVVLLAAAAGLGRYAGAAAGAVAAGLAALVAAAIGLYGAFASSFLVDAVYFEARIERDRWAPSWTRVPDPSWPTSRAHRRAAPRGRLERWGGAWLTGAAIALPLTLGWSPPGGLAARLAEAASAITPSGAVPLAQPLAPAPDAEEAARGAPARQRAESFPWLVHCEPAPATAGEGPRLRLEARVRLEPAPRPGEPSPVWLDVEHVYDNEGGELYAASHPFEAERNRRARLEPLPDEGPGVFRAWRFVHLRAGAEPGSAARVYGAIRWSSPEGPGRRAPFAIVPGAIVSVTPEAGGSSPTLAEAFPDDPDRLARLAYERYGAGRYDEAIALLDRLVAIEPDNAWAFYTRGWAYWKLGERSPAWRDVKRACELGYEDACRLAREGG
ncbi:MAG: tetratricopeptide repeat protein [Acidobacteria bacterium]|nr:MAG: tetratricopeptide repeat protein [Acidobacteriota bacterium]